MWPQYDWEKHAAPRSVQDRRSVKLICSAPSDLQFLGDFFECVEEEPKGGTGTSKVFLSA